MDTRPPPSDSDLRQYYPRLHNQPLVDPDQKQYSQRLKISRLTEEDLGQNPLFLPVWRRTSQLFGDTSWTKFRIQHILLEEPTCLVFSRKSNGLFMTWWILISRKVGRFLSIPCPRSTSSYLRTRFISSSRRSEFISICWVCRVSTPRRS